MTTTLLGPLLPHSIQALAMGAGIASLECPYNSNSKTALIGATATSFTYIASAYLDSYNPISMLITLGSVYFIGSSIAMGSVYLIRKMTNTTDEPEAVPHPPEAVPHPPEALPQTIEHVLQRVNLISLERVTRTAG